MLEERGDIYHNTNTITTIHYYTLPGMGLKESPPTTSHSSPAPDTAKASTTMESVQYKTTPVGTE